MDRFDSMSILVAAVEAGSLSAAARRLAIPLATVSRKVSDLEGHLKTRLLIRSSRKLALTDAGRSYVDACKRILEDVGEAERAATGEFSTAKGNLILSAPIEFGRLHVLPIVIEFLRVYPEIDLRLALTDRIINLFEDRVDLAVRIGELPDSSLVAIRVGSIRRVVCASPTYFAKRGTPARPDELSGHDCVSFEGLTSPDAWVFVAGKSEVRVPIHSRLIVNTAEAAIDATIARVGVTRVLFYQAAQAVRAGKLVLALEDFEPKPSPVNLVHAGGRLLPLKLRAFLDFALPRLKAKLAGSSANA